MFRTCLVNSAGVFYLATLANLQEVLEWYYENAREGAMHQFDEMNLFVADTRANMRRVADITFGEKMANKLHVDK